MKKMEKVDEFYDFVKKNSPQCRYIEHLHEEVWHLKINFDNMAATRT